MMGFLQRKVFLPWSVKMDHADNLHNSSTNYLQRNIVCNIRQKEGKDSLIFFCMTEALPESSLELDVIPPLPPPPLDPWYSLPHTLPHLN
jgi:hypothetical protein